MKKLLVVLMLGVAIGALAQNETLTIRKVKKGDEPKAVIDAIKTDFPKSVQQTMSYLPGKLYGSEWNVSTEGEGMSSMDYFQVDIKQGNATYTAVYDKEGKLLSSKHVISPASLPPLVMSTIKKFSGWHIDRTTELIKYNGKETTDVYRVKLQKGVEHKIVFVDPGGNIVNTRFTVI